MSSDPLPFVKVSLDEAKQALDRGGGPRRVEETDWRWARKWSPPEALKPNTAQWLLNLPKDSRPVDLPQAFPRIANKLCDLWQNAGLCERYFDDLLTDRRGKRQGFPAGVLADIKMLQRLRAQGQVTPTVWENEATRKR